MSVANRGFASMPQQMRKAIAALGGKAAHKKGTAHKWDVKEAAAAGSLGGRATAKVRQKKET